MRMFQTANRSLHQKDGEVKDSQFKIVNLTDEVSRLKKLVETSQVCAVNRFESS